MKSFFQRLRKRLRPRALSRAARLFAGAVGATALCMLAFLPFLGVESSPALEASAFNGGKEFSPGESQAAGAAVSQLPGQVVPLGTAFGIRLFTDGVIVASLSDLYTEEGLRCPAAEAGILPGDYLLKADGMEIPSNGSLARYIGQSAGEPIAFTVRRGQETFTATVAPVWGQGSFKTGMWVRDSAAGIGTLTFYDPETGRFAGLGHGICDMDTSGVMALKSGEPMPITLSGIEKGSAGLPGQLRGYFSSDQPLGALLANRENGVYGTLLSPPEGEAVEVLPREEVRPGPVRLLASVDGAGPQLYQGEIVRLCEEGQSTKNFVVRVTDPALLGKTGGIVQGMSGCPLLQEGKLAGAVTHVFTEEPAAGYGIFAQSMWEECQNCA